MRRQVPVRGCQCHAQSGLECHASDARGATCCQVTNWTLSAVWKTRVPGCCPRPAARVKSGAASAPASFGNDAIVAGRFCGRQRHTTHAPIGGCPSRCQVPVTVMFVSRVCDVRPAAAKADPRSPYADVTHGIGPVSRL
jgi:hypothetical protein